MKNKILAAIIICPLVSFSLAQAADQSGEPPFPKAVEFEIGAHGFANGDQITITSLRGDRRHIEAGGNYLVEGTYTLVSADSASLGFFCTSHGPSGPTPTQHAQIMKITRGSGSFHLYKTNLADGWLHVSFYENGNSHGGVYFGEKGREETMMRKQGWFSDLTTSADTHGSDNKANRALMAYLGDPVPPPSGMNPRYTRENLLKAFTDLCHTHDMVITKLAVDDTEFPFLVYGTLEGLTMPGDMAIKGQNGYTYGGAVHGTTDNRSTFFAVNMVPASEYPAGEEKNCNRRLTLRLQMLADKAR